MLVFDGAVEQITLDSSVENPLMDQMRLPVVDVRPTCIAVRYSNMLFKPRHLRITKSGGIYFCRDDKVLESFDGRTVTLVGDLMRCAAGLQRPSSGAEFPKEPHARVDDAEIHLASSVEVRCERTVLLLWGEGMDAERNGGTPPMVRWVGVQCSDTASYQKLVNGLRSVAVSATFTQKQRRFDDSTNRKQPQEQGTTATTNRKNPAAQRSSNFFVAEPGELEQKAEALASDLIDSITSRNTTVLSPFLVHSAKKMHSVTEEDEVYPVSVLDALQSRRAEYFDRVGVAEFFELCQRFYDRGRAALDDKTRSLRIQAGLLVTQLSVTELTVEQLFQKWRLQRKKETYQLREYLMDLQRYVWDLEDIKKHSRSGDDASSVNESRSTRQNPLLLLNALRSDREVVERCGQLHAQLLALLEELRELQPADHPAASADGFSQNRRNRVSLMTSKSRTRSNVFHDTAVDMMKLQ